MTELNLYRKSSQGRAWVLGLLFLVVSLSSMVWIEPSPYDVLFLLFILLGCFFSFYRFHAQLVLPLSLLLLFLFANLLSAFFAKDVGEAMSFLAITLFLAVSWLALIGVSYRYRSHIIETVFKGYVIAALLAVLLGLFAYFMPTSLTASLLEFGRVRSLFKDPNVFGPFVVPAALFLLYKSETATLLKKLWFFSLFFLFLLGILLSFSRAAWGNCALALGCYFLIARNVPWKKRITTLIIFLIVGIGLFLYLINTPMIDGLLDQRIGMQHYDTDRFATQKAAFEAGFSNLLGMGPGQVEENFSLSTHSLYARIFTENGLLGFLSFCLFLLAAMAKAFRRALDQTSQSQTRGLYLIIFASLVGAVFNSFFIDTLHWRHLWLLLALAWCMEEPKKDVAK